MAMHDDDRPTPSDEQREWQRLHAEIREAMARKAQTIPDMTPEQVQKFVEAVQAQQWTEFQAHTWDSRLERATEPFSNY